MARSRSSFPSWFTALLYVVILVAALFVTGERLWDNYLFATRSHPSMGKVVNKYMQTIHDRHGTHYTPCLQYRYRVGPMVVHATTNVLSSTYSYAAISAWIPIVYLENNSARSRIDLPAENERLLWTTRGLVAFCIFFMGVGVFLYRHKVQNRPMDRFSSSPRERYPMGR